MLTVDTSVTPFRFIQAVERPCVYLDHCALRQISQDSVLAARFRELLISRNGTLMVSEMNLIEFVNVGDVGQATMADNLLQSIYPRLCFIDTNVLTVREREKASASDYREWKVDLPCESKTLRDMTSAWIRADRVMWPANGLMVSAKQLPPETRKIIADADANATENLRKYKAMAEAERAEERALRRKHLRMLRDPRMRIPSLSNLFASRLMTEFDKLNRLVEQNDSRDFSHAGVPAIYCDAIVLDSKWADLVERAKRRLVDQGIRAPIARPFKCTPNGLSGLLANLERVYPPRPTIAISIETGGQNSARPQG